PGRRCVDDLTDLDQRPATPRRALPRDARHARVEPTAGAILPDVEQPRADRPEDRARPAAGSARMELGHELRRVALSCPRITRIFANDFSPFVSRGFARFAGAQIGAREWAVRSS